MKLEHKEWLPEIKLLEDSPNGGFRMYGSTFGNVDRGGEAVDTGAFRNLEVFKRDGFIPLGHDWNGLPIAMVKDAHVDSHGLVVEAEFHSHPAAQDARRVIRERLAAGKSVSTSIGYVTRDAEMIDGVKHLKEIDLFEVSFVNVPMNPQAIVLGAKAEEKELLHVDATVDPGPVVLHPEDDQDSDEEDTLDPEAGNAANADNNEESDVPIPGAKDTAESTLPAGVTFVDHAEAVLAAVAELMGRAKAIHDLRTKAGRRLSTESIAKIQAMHDQLEEIQTGMRGMIADCNPPEKRVDVRKEYLRFMQIEADLVGKI